MSKILLVEDTPSTIDLIKTLLVQQGYSVYITTNGYDALEIVEEVGPDLILLDILMPVMDGYETCQSLKQNPATRSIPVIFMSALAKSFDKVKAFQVGGVDYITKPIEAEEMLARITNHLNLSQLRKELNRVNSELEEKVRDRTAELTSANHELELSLEQLKDTSLALAKEEEKFRTIFDNGADAIFIVDLDGRFVDASKTTMERLATTKEYLVGRNIAEIVEPGDISRIKDQIGRMGLNQVVQIDTSYMHPVDKSRVYIDLKCRLMEYEGVKAILCFSRNVTEIVQSKAELQRSEERYKLIAKEITDSMYKVIVPPEGHAKVRLSVAGEALLGYSSVESLVEDWPNAIHKSDQHAFSDFYNEVLTTHETKTLEHRICHKDGSVIWVRNTLFFVSRNIEGTEEFNGVISNISEQKELEKLMLSSIIQTEEKERSYFARELHDGIGPVLSALKMYVNWLATSETNEENLDVIHQAAETLEEAVSGIKEISNNLSPHILKNFGLITALNSFIEKFASVSPLDISLDTNIADLRLNENIETTLYRVLTESLNNTHKHASATQVNIKIAKQYDKLYVVYSDNGKGFDIEEELNKRSGIGLFNMQNRINTIGGSMTLKSELGQGVKCKIIVNIEE